MRFKPIWIGPWRYTARDAIIGKGTHRERLVKAGTVVMPATLSAMFDADAVQNPNAFDTSRPHRDYMVFGHGIHQCIGAEIARIQIGESLRALFQKQGLRRMPGKAGRMTRMVDDMFSLALADLDARPLQLEEVYLNEVVTDCVGAAQVLAGARSVSVQALAPADVQMQADESLLRQMILNLVENAVRHTPPNGSVLVSLDADPDRARISVSDTGPGIPEVERERIFERFVRLDAATDGGGLGLPIARWVAQLHRGTLTLESSGPGGSRFVAVLPLH